LRGTFEITGLITARNLLTVELTIGLKEQIWTGLSAPKTQKAGRQNGGDFGQVLGRRFGWHSPLNGKRSERVYDFT
jgi:hypothetical protein